MPRPVYGEFVILCGALPCQRTTTTCLTVLVSSVVTRRK